jgi:hypothetical protein
MDLYQFIHDRSNDIVAEAEQAVRRAHLKNYEKEEPDAVHQRLKALLVLTSRAVKERNLGPLVDHCARIARDRFSAGYDLWEVQTAFNVLEEVLWQKILRELPPAEYAEALGLISTVLGTGKDTLGRVYVTLASKERTPTLDLRSLFTGMEGQ